MKRYLIQQEVGEELNVKSYLVVDDVQLHWNFSQVGLKIILKNSQVLPSVGWIVLYVFLLQGSGKDCIWNAKKDTDRARISGRSVVALVRGSNQAVKTHTVFSPPAASLGSFRLRLRPCRVRPGPGSWADLTRHTPRLLHCLKCFVRRQLRIEDTRGPFLSFQNEWIYIQWRTNWLDWK